MKRIEIEDKNTIIDVQKIGVEKSTVTISQNDKVITFDIYANELTKLYVDSYMETLGK